MSKKKGFDMDNMSAPKTAAEVDAMMNSADVVVQAEPKIKPLPEPTVRADINKLAADIRLNGGVKLQVVEGTASPKLISNEPAAINDGGNEVVVLKLDFFGSNKGAI